MSSSSEEDNSTFWQSDACIRAVNLKHNVEFVSPVYLSELSRTVTTQPTTTTTKSNQQKQQNEEPKVSEQGGILFIQNENPRFLSEQRKATKTIRKKWVLERVVAMPPTTNASEWLGDMNRCIIRLSQSMKRSVVPKLNESVTSHMTLAGIVPVSPTITTTTTAEQSQKTDDAEFLIIREALHDPTKSNKKLQKFFDKLPVSSSRQLSDLSAATNEQRSGFIIEEDKEQVKRVSLESAEDFQPFSYNSDDGKNTINRHNFFLSVSSPSALVAPRNHNEPPTHMVRNWISTRISASSAPYYSFLTGNSLNVDALEFSSKNEEQIEPQRKEAEEDEEEEIEKRRKQQRDAKRNELYLQSPIINEVLTECRREMKLLLDGDTNLSEDQKNSLLLQKCHVERKDDKLVLVKPIQLDEKNIDVKLELPLRLSDDNATHELHQLSSFQNSPSTRTTDDNKKKAPLQEHQNLHERIQQKLDHEFQVKIHQKEEAQERVLNKLVDSPEYAVCFDLIQDEDKNISASNPVRKLHDLDPDKVDENALFSLSHHLGHDNDAQNKKNENGKSLFDSSNNPFGNNEDIFSDYLSKVLLRPLSTFFRLIHTNVNAHPVERDGTEIHSATHAVLGQSDEAPQQTQTQIFEQDGNPFTAFKNSKLFSLFFTTRRPWLLDLYWDKTRLPPHRITSEVEQYTGGRCEMTFAESPSWTFFGSWKDRSISSAHHPMVVYPHQQQKTEQEIQDQEGDAAPFLFFPSIGNKRAVQQTLSRQRETVDAQISPSPKQHSTHRDPTWAGVLATGSIRKRPQVTATRIVISTNVDATVKDLTRAASFQLKSGKRNLLSASLNASGNNNLLLATSQNENDDDNGETPEIMDLDATAKEATFMLQNELGFLRAQDQQQQQRQNNHRDDLPPLASAPSPQTERRLDSEFRNSSVPNNNNEDGGEDISAGQQQQQQVPFNRNQNNNNNNLPSFNSLLTSKEQKQISEAENQKHSRTTASCRRHYEKQYHDSPYGKVIEALFQKNKNNKINGGNIPSMQQKKQKQQQQILLPSLSNNKNVVHIADGRTLEIGASYHYRWKRDWEVDEEVDVDDNNINNNERSFKYRAFWDRFETRAVCSLMCGYARQAPEITNFLSPAKKQHQQVPSQTTANKPPPTPAHNNPVLFSPSPQQQQAANAKSRTAVLGENRIPTKEERSVLRRNYQQQNGNSSSAAILDDFSGLFFSSYHNQQQQQFDTTTAISKLYSILNTSASWIAERNLSAHSLLRFRGGFRWSIASTDINSIPTTDVEQQIQQTQSSNSSAQRYGEFLKGSPFLNYIFGVGSSTSIHQPQVAWSLELETDKFFFVPFLRMLPGMRTNFFLGGSASCRLLESSDFLSAAMNRNNAQQHQNSGVSFSSLLIPGADISNASNLIPPVIARAAESRVKNFIHHTTAENKETNDNIFTSLLNLRAWAQLAAGFSIAVPLRADSEESLKYSERGASADGHEQRVEFSYWWPIWSFDSFSVGKPHNDGFSAVGNKNNGIIGGGMQRRVGISLIL